MPMKSSHQHVVVDTGRRACSAATIVGILTQHISKLSIAMWAVCLAAPPLRGVGGTRIACPVRPAQDVFATVCETGGTAHSVSVDGAPRPRSAARGLVTSAPLHTIGSARDQLPSVAHT
jgi:hypothetical protein